MVAAQRQELVSSEGRGANLGRGGSKEEERGTSQRKRRGLEDKGLGEFKERAVPQNVNG